MDFMILFLLWRTQSRFLRDVDEKCTENKVRSIYRSKARARENVLAWSIRTPFHSLTPCWCYSATIYTPCILSYLIFQVYMLLSVCLSSFGCIFIPFFPIIFLFENPPSSSSVSSFSNVCSLLIPRPRPFSGFVALSLVRTLVISKISLTLFLPVRLSCASFFASFVIVHLELFMTALCIPLGLVIMWLNLEFKKPMR